ncbi:hypothetical protein VFPPC_07866 [Pochonia chlamydosporia 170]|uniref:Uncharacterized protein n=1 Tax=Pochonia chlamydosporia 170 TaxID=1380566 RepID=A0A179FMA4_METCM|nr:hypothetical protein VFPPC_07866 [Pochonia chlamydosporia 170]OAQ66301.2 hypothetical protein VFPPC_07866 [Pochonia chlamydosporia 170]
MACVLPNEPSHHDQQNRQLDAIITDIRAGPAASNLPNIPPAARRRRLQNRLNQRNSAKKKLMHHDGSRKWVVYIGGELPSQDDRNKNQQAITANATSIYGILNNVHSQFCQLNAMERNAFLSQLHHRVIWGSVNQLLRSELLLPVTQYNIFTAAAANASSIGISMESLRHDILSPFVTCQPLKHDVPPTLEPTLFQRQVLHHPWIDLFPMADVRDTMLRHIAQYDEDELCHDMFAGGLFIWGEPWDPFAYEVAEHVVKKWLWLFGGCVDMLRSTNRWRRSRGEKILAFS